MTPRTEHPVDQLADTEVQAAASKVAHRLARRVPQHGGSNDRLRECLFRSVHRAPFPSDNEHEPKLLRPNLQGTHCTPLQLLYILTQTPGHAGRREHASRTTARCS
jgi:hypothetical protein